MPLPRNITNYRIRIVNEIANDVERLNEERISQILGPSLSDLNFGGSFSTTLLPRARRVRANTLTQELIPVRHSTDMDYFGSFTDRQSYVGIPTHRPFEQDYFTPKQKTDSIEWFDCNTDTQYILSKLEKNNL